MSAKPLLCVVHVRVHARELLVEKHQAVLLVKDLDAHGQCLDRTLQQLPDALVLLPGGIDLVALLDQVADVQTHHHRHARGCAAFVHVHPGAVRVVAHLWAGPVATKRHFVRQPQLFLAAGLLGDAMAQARAQQLFIGLAQRFRHRQVRAQACHLVVAQHQAVVLVVDFEPGGHGIDGLAQAAFGALGIVQRLLEGAFLVHDIGDVGTQHHHAASFGEAFGDAHPAVALDLLHFRQLGCAVAGHAVGEPGVHVGPRIHNVARARGAAQHILEQRAVFDRHRGARVHLAVLGVAQHQAVVSVVDGQPVRQDVERGRQLGARALGGCLGLAGRGAQCQHLPHQPP